jgi:hypothetical protein
MTEIIVPFLILTIPTNTTNIRPVLTTGWSYEEDKEAIFQTPLTSRLMTHSDRTAYLKTSIEETLLLRDFE